MNPRTIRRAFVNALFAGLQVVWPILSGLLAAIAALGLLNPVFAGAAMAIGFPYLIWKRFKWVTRILAVLVLVRVIGLVRIVARGGTEPVPLPWGGEIASSQGALLFMLIAMTTCILLARAGWQRRPAGAS